MVDLTISMRSAAEWVGILPKLTFYAEEADIRLDGPTVKTAHDDLGNILGIKVRVPGSNVARLHDIVTKAGLVGLHLSIRPVPNWELPPTPPRDPKKAKDHDRTLPSEHPNYTLTRDVHIEFLKEEGRRQRTDAEGKPVSDE